MSWNSGFQIRVVEGPDQGSLVPLSQTRLMIGRSRAQGSSAEGWVLVFDKSVSRQHAELNWSETDESFRLKHLSKTNFTWLDEVPVEGEVLLAPGQIIKVGSSLLLFEPLDEELLNSSNAHGETPAIAPEGELAERMSHSISPVNLRSGSLNLRVIQGPDAGKDLNLSGFYIVIGRANRSAAELTGDPKALPFDQMIEVNDPQTFPNHLILKWEELSEGFRAWKNPESPPVALARESDGILWQATLPDTGGLLRKGDRVQIGQIWVQFTPSQVEETKEAIRPLPLSVLQPEGQ